MAKNDGYQLIESQRRGEGTINDSQICCRTQTESGVWLWMWLWMGFADTDSEIQRFRDAATERRRVGASLQIRNETFHSDWKMLSNHRRTNTNDCDEPTSDHKTKQANFQLILTRSTKAKTGNGHGPWPKRLGTMLWTPRTEDLAKKTENHPC